MHGIRFDKIGAIKSALSHLKDLVAVFSRENAPDLMLVYNCDAPPPPQRKITEVISIHDLVDRDLSRFDGPAIGFSALDVIREDVPTKGPEFYAIEHVFQERGLDDSLNHTRHRLARFLIRYLDDLPAGKRKTVSRRGESKALQLALPTILSQHPTQDLVAILPGPDLERFVAGQEFHSIYGLPSGSVQLEALGVGSEDWVIALEEVQSFQPAINPQSPHFIELRHCLRQAGQTDVLYDTCCRLAWHCLQSDMVPTAVTLLAEAWLAQEDVEDLLALIPCEDLARFAETGEGLRVYRTLAHHVDGARTAGVSLTLEALLRQGIPSGYTGFGLSLVPLSILLETKSQFHWLDLGQVLWKAGQGQALARTLWLTARDGLHGAEHAVSSPRLDAETLTNLSTQAVALYGLDDPWRWRQGRYNLYMADCCQTLQRAKEHQAKTFNTPFASYHQALSLWFGCYNADDATILDNLENLANRLRDFVWRTRNDERGPSLVAARATAEHLTAIARVILRLPADVGPSPEQDSPEGLTTGQTLDVTKVLRIAAQSANLSIPTPFFNRAFQLFLALRAERHRIQWHESSIDTRFQKFAQLAAKLERQRRLVFALPHEVSILCFAYAQEIQRLTQLLDQLEAGAVLEIILEHPKVDLRQVPDVQFQVLNVGDVSAEGVEIDLLQSSDFELLEGSPIRKFAIVPPNFSQTLSFSIRPFQPDVTLELSYSYTVRGEPQQEGGRQFRVKVEGLDMAPFKFKVNRYALGRPIQDPNDFFGRREELKNVLSLLAAGGKQNVLLRGPRRMGKTSLMYMLQQALKSPTTRRLFDLPSEWDAPLDRFHSLLLSLQSLQFQDGAVSVEQFFYALLEQVCATLGVQGRRRAAMMRTYGKRRRDVGVVNAAREQLDKVLGERPGEQIVVLLDEYDEVYRPEGDELDRNLRDLVSSEQRLTWIIASTLGLYKESKSTGSPWFNVFMIVELDRLTERAARDLVEVPSQGERVYWRSDAVQSLLEETGFHPAFTQLFCSKVIDYLNREQTNYVLNDVIASIAHQVVGERKTAHSHFDFYWNDAPGLGKLVLLAVDDSETPLSRKEIRWRTREWIKDEIEMVPTGWVFEQFKDGIDWVEKTVGAIKHDERWRYSFSVPLFRRWLSRRRQYKNLLEEAVETIRLEMERDSVP